MIEIEPQKFLLDKADLPIEAKYFLPGPEWVSPQHNTEIISSWVGTTGRDYIEATGRVDGWFVYFDRGSIVLQAPEQLYHEITMFETVAGARIALFEYDLNFREPDQWEILDVPVDHGDAALVEIKKEIQPNGRTKINYGISFTYRNYLSSVFGNGWEEDVTHEFVEMVSRAIYQKLLAAPLVAP